MLRVAVDFGTSSTCAAMSVDGRPPQVVVIDGAPLLPSSVYLSADGALFVGHEADRQAAVDPSRYEPHPKRRIDEPELLLGDTVLPVIGVVRAVLRRALQEARRLAGGAPVDQLVLTHPADWGATRTRKLRRCAQGLATEIALVPEPVAAAVFYTQGHAVPEGGCLAVLDLGGGTVDASVVQRTRSAFNVLATRGDPNFGGADIDQALLDYVGGQLPAADQQAWSRLVAGRELVERRRLRVLRQDVRGAKETLSRHSYADVPMPPPFPDAHVTRADLERLISVPLHGTVALLEETIAAAGRRPDELAGVFLVGGSSRIPMVSRLLHEQLGVLPVTLDQPETVAARGALHAVVAQPVPASRPFPAVQPAGVGPPAALGAPSRPVAVAGPAVRLGQPPLPSVLPPPSPPRGQRWQRRRPWLVAAAVLAATALAAVVGAVVVDRAGLPGERQVADYHYRFTLPGGWQQSGGNQAARQVELRPVDGAATPDRIFVREAELDYDGEADRGRAVGELRTQYDARKTVSTVDGFDPSTSFAGRDVLYYSERVTAGTVDWYVLFGGHYQVSVGCQHDQTGIERVRAACERVVGTLTVDATR